MKTIAEIRLKNLLELRATYGTTRGLANALSKNEGQVGQWLRSVRSVGNNIAREIEMSLSLPVGWLDHDHAGAEVPQSHLHDGRRLYGDEIELLEFYGECDPLAREILRDLANKFRFMKIERLRWLPGHIIGSESAAEFEKYVKTSGDDAPA